MEEGRSALRIVTAKSTGKRPLGRHSLRWEGNIKMVVKEIGVNTKYRVYTAEDMGDLRALVSSALHLRVS